jgi:hypothetical protein
MSDAELQAIRERASYGYDLDYNDGQEEIFRDLAALLAEIDRLRAEIAKWKGTLLGLAQHHEGT